MRTTVKRNKKILKNSSNEISHTIKKMKEKEIKYTIILVSFFFILFCFIGYYTLKINESEMKHLKMKNLQEDTIALSGNLITLTNDNIIINNKKDRQIETELIIENNYHKTTTYQITFTKDEYMAKQCGCLKDDFPNSTIHYTINDSEEKECTSTSTIIEKGTITGNSKKTLFLKMWMTQSEFLKQDSHFHGYFSIEEIK